MKSDTMRSFVEFLDMNRRLVIACAVGGMMILCLQFFVHNASKECIGIADTKETVVSFEVPVLVKRVYVLPGQVVKKGQPLLEVEVPETKLKLLEVQTMLESLESEQDVRNVLLDSFTGKGSKKKIGQKSPIAQEIAGLRRQLTELQNQQSQAVRYAEADGVVATVAFGPREQAAPFSPIITLTPFVPNYAYGFINEKVNSDLKIGETVMIEPLNDSSRAATGRVISIGARITAFTDRLQMINTTSHGNSKGSNGNNMTPMYFGRELVVSIDPKNQIVIGEKVHIRARETSRLSELGFQAFADSSGPITDIQSDLLASGLPMEASGLIMMPGQNALLAASDENGPAASPFWKFSGEGMKDFTNLPMRGLKAIEDVEAVSYSAGNYFALSSLSKSSSGKGKAKKARSLIIRFSVDDQGVLVDRSFELRAPLIAALQALPVLQSIQTQLDDIEVESLALNGDDAYVGLKEPQMPDGSSIILKLPGLIRQLNEGTVTAVLADVQAVVRMDTESCSRPARISELVKTPAGLLVLGNCKKSDATGKIWWLADNSPNHEMTVISLLRNGRPEGMAVNPELNGIYLVSDNGNKAGADLMKITIPVPLQ